MKTRDLRRIPDEPDNGRSLQPAASLIDFAMRAGAVTVQVNPNPTGLESQVTYEFPLTAGVVLPEIIARLRASG